MRTSLGASHLLASWHGHSKSLCYCGLLVDTHFLNDAGFKFRRHFSPRRPSPRVTPSKMLQGHNGESSKLSHETAGQEVPLQMEDLQLS